MQGNGVEVVQVKGHVYELDLDGLKKILLRHDVKDLPVVVVSVAGAFRGGKSFLLNFFLRYLTAPQSSQADGSWLGTDEIPLEGFSWRGGAQRNTTGIVMWSEPVVTNLITGEKVAVILMDTQGTYDSSSTVRDSSTIFALSTLLSSVQIYNISQNIREDDLQHLQLFTEYGSLIRDKSGKAFQVLEFLIRDWQNPTDYPYGSAGGKLYMEQKFQTESIQAKELRDIRAHIRENFTTLSCFLMPHPGLEVAEADFKGKVNEISIKFKTYIRELTSHLFGPGQLQVKEINGQTVKASELYTYFETYMTIFNSDTIPTPTTVYEATAKAGLLAAFEEARRTYETGMEADCGVAQPTVPAHDLKDRHDLHASRAVASFTDKKKMGSKDAAKTYLNKLKEELKKRAPEFLEINKSKFLKMMDEANKAYEAKIGQIKAEKSLCVHPLDLQHVHTAGLQAAIALFDNNRRCFSKKPDTERDVFIKDYEKQYELLKRQNQENNKIAVTELRLEYWTTMESKCSETLLSDNEFHEEHRRALADALEGFAGKRNHPNSYEEDEFQSSLIEMIESRFDQMKAINKSKNKVALQAAIKAYEDHMASAWEPKNECLHPVDLDEEHSNGERCALTALRPEKVSSGRVFFDTTDDDEKLLAKILHDRFSEFEGNNDSGNETAVQTAENVYSKEMYYYCGFSGWWLLFGVPYLVNKSKRNEYHNICKSKALNAFYEKRHGNNRSEPDRFLDKLGSKIAAERKKY